jgi:hypothetical protein
MFSLSAFQHVESSDPIGIPGPLVAPSLVVAAKAIGVGLSAICAAAATVGGFSLLAVLVYVADEHLAIEAGAGTPHNLLYLHGSAATGEGRAPVRYGRGSGARTETLVARVFGS